MWHWLVVGFFFFLFLFLLSFQHMLNIVFVCICFKCFYIVAFDQYFLAFSCQKSKNTKKVKNPKSLINIFVFCLKHILPCTFVLMVLCIYKLNLFSMHLYHCGRNLDFYVIVVNRSSNLSWMVSQWSCWSWDMHRLVPIYLLTLLFYCFCLKSSTNVNLQMKRDNELQKPVAYTSIWLGKRESDFI